MVDFQCRVIFTCYVRASNLPSQINIEVMHEKSLVSVKVKPRLTTRLSSVLVTLTLFYLRD